MAGIRTPQNITEAARIDAGSDKPSLQKLMPEAFGAFVGICERLEKHYRDMQDLEFTIERGKLWMLQTRSGKRTAKAAIRIAVEMASEGLISREEAISRVDPASLDQLLHPTIDPERRARHHRRRPAGFAGCGDRRDRVFLRRCRGDEGQGPQGRAGAHRDQPRGHPRHARRRRHPDDARRHDQPRRGGGARHGQALRFRGRLAARRLSQRHADGDGRHAAQGRRHHHRRRHRAGAEGRGADAAAGALRRFRQRHGVGRRDPPHEGAHQCRDAGRCAHGALVRRRGHRALPHRAHVLRGRPHRRHARDDPGRHREGPPRRARQAVADAALGFPGAVRDHGRAAGDDPPARSAAARIPAQDRGRDRRGRRRHAGFGGEAAPPDRGAARVQPDARPSRLPARRLLSRDRRDAGARHLRGGGRRGEEDRKPGRARDHGAAGQPQEGARFREGAHRRGGARR